MSPERYDQAIRTADIPWAARVRVAVAPIDSSAWRFEIGYIKKRLWVSHSMFMKGIQAKHVPALFIMHDPRTDLEAMLQICTLRSAPAVATRPWPPPADIARAVTGMAWAANEQKGATPPEHNEAKLQT